MPRHRRFACLLAAGLSLPAFALAATIDLHVNGRSYALPDTTPVTIDGAPALLGDLATHRNGLQARIDFGAAANAGEGAAPTLVFSYTLMGPVTQSDRGLRIAGSLVRRRLRLRRRGRKASRRFDAGQGGRDARRLSCVA